MDTPHEDIAGCGQSHIKLSAAISGLTDDQVRHASMLPGWSVGHVLSHLARNAEAMHRRIEASLKGRIVDQYLGGIGGRTAEIDAGAVRSADEIVADVASTAEQLDAAFASVPEAQWSRPVRTVSSEEHPMSMLPFRRWREVEVHLVDLGVGPTAADWPAALVERVLPRLMTTLADRADQRALMAWALGRDPAPELDAWG